MRMAPMGLAVIDRFREKRTVIMEGVTSTMIHAEIVQSISERMMPPGHHLRLFMKK
jgi:hypothetical protein